MPIDKSLQNVLVGVVIGAVLGSFATGWVMRNRAATPSQAVGAPAAPPSANTPQAGVGPQTGGATGTQPTVESSGVVINDKELSSDQMQELLKTYGAAPPKGRYWYDSKSGLYGYWGREAAGYIRPGHNFGSLSPRASNGNTGVFLNGREINLTEAQFFQRLFGVVYLGHFWLDGTNGNMGIDGNPTPLANLILAVQQAQQQGGGGGGEYHWRDGSGGVVSSGGNCTFAAIPGAPVYSTPGCG